MWCLFRRARRVCRVFRRTTKGGGVTAICLYSNRALIGALLAFGHQARHININSEAVSGHEVTEVWSNEFNKWIYMDATRDYYYFDKKTGAPLNPLENTFQNSIL